MIPLTEINNNNIPYQTSEIIKTDRLLESEFNKISNKIENDGVKLECKYILAELFGAFISGACISEFYEKSQYGPLITCFVLMGIFTAEMAKGIFDIIQLKKHSIPLDEIKTDLSYELLKNVSKIPDDPMPIHEDRTDKIKAETIDNQRKAIQPLAEKAYNCLRFMLFTEVAKENDIPPEVAKLIGTQLSELK